MTESRPIPDNWGRERLMGKSVSFKGMPPAEEAENGKGPPPSPKRKSKSGKDSTKLDPMLWGQPGHLTEAETDVYFKFREEVEKRGGDFKDTIYSFGQDEGEVWALCRWLRARKYVYDDVITMIEEATETRSVAKSTGFYPNPLDALGCEPSLFFNQYPQLYSGVAKNGAPIFISKPGVLNVDAMECCTTLEGIVKFHWYVMMHDFKIRLQAQKDKDPEHFHRYDCVCILDLSHLTLSQLTSKALTIIKEQSAIDGICFPETMNKMFIINGPRFFSPTWKLIRGWLDARTANKIEVISDRKSWEKRLLEYVDEVQLPSDYGGKGQDTGETIVKEAYKGDLKRMHTEVIYLRGHGSVSYEIAANEELSISIYTRCPKGAKFTITDAKKHNIAEHVEVTHDGTDDVKEYPTSKVINPVNVPGPGVFKVKADSNTTRFSSSNFLVVFSVFPKK